MVAAPTAGPWPGVDPAWSRIVEVPSTAAASGGPAGGRSHRWHVLDNLEQLRARGVEPAGTLLCVHGNPTWSYLWRSLLAAGTDAARPWRVVAVDQLDMGFSERTGAFRRLADRVADLSDLTAALGLEGPVVTAGHDWGGLVSLGWALRHREQLAGVVLTNTAVHPAGYDVPAVLRPALHPALHRWGTTTSTAFLDVTHALASPRLEPAVRRAYLAPYRTAARREGVGRFVSDIPAAPGHPSWAALEEIAGGVRSLDVPALLLWGPRDPVFSDRYLRDLMDRLPHADVHRFEGAGHLLIEDRDLGTPVFEWLAVSAPAPAAPGGPGVVPDYVPMTAELDARRSEAGTAVVDMTPEGPVSLDWAGLVRRVDHLAAGLRAAGVRPGDRVSLLVPPGIELTSLIYACLRLGAVIVVADAGLGTRGLGRAITGAGPAYLVGIDRALAGARALGWPGRRIGLGSPSSAKRRLLGIEHTLGELLESGAREESASGRLDFDVPAPDADAAVLFTSGSTGPAKGVVYTHRRLAAMRDTLKDGYGIREGEGLVAGFAPFALLGPALGATSVTPDMDVTAPRTLTASALAEAAAAIDATIVFASPAALANVQATADGLDAAGREALGRVRLLLSAGAPIPEPLLARLQPLVPAAALHTPYGMTEALPVTDIDLAGIRAAGQGNGVCVGRPLPGVAVAVAGLDDAGRATGESTTVPGTTGEVLVAAPHVKERYDRLWHTERAASSLPGWHRTGDVGHLDAEGRLWIEGRLGHVLTTASGVRTPVAAEQHAEAVPEVARAAVVGVGPAGAQVPVAVVETTPPAPRPGLAPGDLTRSVRAAVANGTGLELAAVLAVPSLPTDIRHNSKIDRTALAAWSGKALGGGGIGTP
ncbi:alpha/beta fold hydrolase [Zafaria sp. J156]|uniref:alpha/beta fold hydrolase n=1 Tax=Zafaria sp. J156 TaxID=3116490 RepID=UPI002E79A661|nr:alpha/beta fold hydrolase [Zafaria sp. J156]MEE1620705.1 alpha/beta fold hydrolase [Zafaria sp. J156]